MENYSHPSMLQSIYEELISAPGHPSISGFELPIFNATNDPAFAPAPTTLMGMFTDLTIQPNYTYLVSRQWFDRRH
jgi:hypothetical protein